MLVRQRSNEVLVAISNRMGEGSVVQSWASLFRIGNSLTGIFGVFLGAVLAIEALPHGSHSQIISLQAFSVLTFMCSWNALNDYMDIEIDRENRPERPLPSGKISINSAKKAILLTSSLSIASIILAGTIASQTENGLTDWLPSLAIWFFALALLINYESPLSMGFGLKDRGLPGNIAISLSVAMVIIFGSAGVNEPLNPRAWTVAIIGFLYNLSREIVKDVEDMEGDRGRKTLAMRIGPENARMGAWVILLAALASMLFPFSFGIFKESKVVFVIPAMITLLMAKPKILSAEDFAAQMLIKRSMQLCLFSFLAISLLPN